MSGFGVCMWIAWWLFDLGLYWMLNSVVILCLDMCVFVLFVMPVFCLLEGGLEWFGGICGLLLL